MAYLNFSDTHEAIHAPTTAESRAFDTRGRLSALEWSVVALAQRDRLSSINTPGRVSKAMGVVFGKKRNSQLADPRLEGLRRIAVIAWHRGYAIPAREIAAFQRTGFSLEQYETILASISRGRVKRDRRAYA